MTISKGVGLAIGWGVESTYGTPNATPTAWTEAVSCGIKQTGGANGTPTLRTRSIRHYAPKKLVTEGPIEAIGSYKGASFLGLLKMGMGASSSSTPAGAQSEYTHTLTLADALSAYTFEVKPDSGELAKSLQFPGCKVGKISLSVEQEDALRATFDITGDGNMTEVTSTTVTYPTHENINWDDVACTINTVATKIHSFSLDIDNALEVSTPLGQLDAQANEPKSERKVSGQISVILDGNTQMALFQGMTEANIVLTFTGSLIGGAIYHTFIIRIPRAVFTGGTPDINTDGPLMLEMPFDAYYDVANTLGEVQITATNTTATI